MTHSQTAAAMLADGPSNCISVLDAPDHLTGTGRQLLLRDARKLLNAEAYTAAQGNPFLVHATLWLSLAEGFTPETWPAFQTALLDKASRWMERRGLIPAYAWSRENGPVKGPHLHAFFPVPQPMWKAFKLYLLRAGNFTPHGPGGEAIRLTGGRFGTYTPKMRAGLCCYALKSLVPDACPSLGIRHEPTLPVPHKRVGTSANIGPQARKAAGWREMHSVAELCAHLHPGAANDNQAEDVSDVA